MNSAGTTAESQRWKGGTQGIGVGEFIAIIEVLARSNLHVEPEDFISKQVGRCYGLAIRMLLGDTQVARDRP